MREISQRRSQGGNENERQVPRDSERHSWQWRCRRSHEPGVRRSDRLSDHAIHRDLGDLRGLPFERRLQCLGQASVLLRARGRTFRAERRARRGPDRRQVCFQRLVQPGHPVRAGIALRHRRQESRRLRPACGGARRLQALAQRYGGSRRHLRAAPVGLHDPVRQQSAGGRRSRGDRLQAQRAVADSGRQRNGRLRHEPHDVRGHDAGAGAPARVPRRSGRLDQMSDDRPGDAVRRQGPRQPSCSDTSRGTTETLRRAMRSSSRPSSPNRPTPSNTTTKAR